MVLSRTERFWPSLSRCCGASSSSSSNSSGSSSSSSISSVPVLVVTLAIVSLASSTLGVNALDTGIDLLEPLRSEFSRYGLTLTHGHTAEKLAYHFPTAVRQPRNLSLPSDTYQRAAEAIRRSSDFTLIATIRQEESNIGTIVSFSYDQSTNSQQHRYLELQSSGRKNEIRFHYSALESDGQLKFHTETFSYRLADKTWHKVALSVSGSEIRLLIDCNPLPSRVTHFVPDRNFSASTMKLFLGESHQGQYPLKGDIEEARIVPGPFGYLTQCPHVSTSCPTCGEFYDMQNRVAACEQNFERLSSQNLDQDRQIQQLKDMIRLLQEGDYRRPCTVQNGSQLLDGASWIHDCQNCSCERGQITCGPMQCPATNCKNPEPPKPGQCCPVCKKKCLMNQRDYEHLEKQHVNCSTCTCNDSTMTCVPDECPVLTCANQTNLTGSCCPVCEGDDFCAKGHTCDTNAKCLNLNTQYKCACLSGFQGDGYHCSDIDECARVGDIDGNHCQNNTRCVNQPGNYTCECLPGYQRTNAFKCEDTDECRGGQHQCPANSECQNTVGAYRCRCRTGYEETPSADGGHSQCTPICNQTCTNGGRCVQPGICACPLGYMGESCERDLDECTTGRHHCKANEVCVNLLAGFRCDCKPGFERIAPSALRTSGNAEDFGAAVAEEEDEEAECVDIDECYQRSHTCNSPARCVNTDGHFECHCPAEEPTCERSCYYSERVFADGEQFRPENEPCRVCTCRLGVMQCEAPTCNCTSYRQRAASDRDVCCSQCDPQESCRHQELPHVEFRSGERWIYRCQTCECLYGEVDCWRLECGALTCDKPLPLAAGECCPRCADDPCGGVVVLAGHGRNQTEPEPLTVAGKPCTYRDRAYESGQVFHDSTGPCTTCSCKNGVLRCNFDTDCNVDDDAPRTIPTGGRHPGDWRPAGGGRADAVAAAGHHDTAAAPQISATAALRHQSQAAAAAAIEVTRNGGQQQQQQQLSEQEKQQSEQQQQHVASLLRQRSSGSDASNWPPTSAVPTPGSAAAVLPPAIRGGRTETAANSPATTTTMATNGATGAFAATTSGAIRRRHLHSPRESESSSSSSSSATTTSIMPTPPQLANSSSTAELVASSPATKLSLPPLSSNRRRGRG